MGQDSGGLKGILAYITANKDRYLGGDPLAILAENEEELTDIAETLAKTFLAEILQFKNGDCLIIKK